MKTMTGKMIMLFLLLGAFAAMLGGSLTALLLLAYFGEDAIGVYLTVLMALCGILWWSINRNRSWLERHRIFVWTSRER